MRTKQKKAQIEQASPVDGHGCVSIDRDYFCSYASRNAKHVRTVTQIFVCDRDRPDKVVLGGARFIFMDSALTRGPISGDLL